jgi:hypothetical protein
MEGGLFISHSAVDSDRIRSVITPVTNPRFLPDAAFLHNRLTGGSELYRLLVQAALHWSASFLVVLSRASLANEWVHAEVEWALERARPVLVARFDETDWATFCEQLQLPEGLPSRRPSGVVDFRHDEHRAAEDLAAALDALPRHQLRG